MQQIQKQMTFSGQENSGVITVNKFVECAYIGLKLRKMDFYVHLQG